MDGCGKEGGAGQLEGSENYAPRRPHYMHCERVEHHYPNFLTK